MRIRAVASTAKQITSIKQTPLFICRARDFCSVVAGATAQPPLAQAPSSSRISNYHININNNAKALFSSSSSLDKTAQPPLDLGKYYHIEASNVSSKGHNVTKLVVVGPDVDGILASMTVALAVQGCSLVELHASSMAENDVSEKEQVSQYLIKDTFYVLNSKTNAPFLQDQLSMLAQALLKAAQEPMKVMGEMERIDPEMEQLLRENVSIPEEQITIVPSTI